MKISIIIPSFNNLCLFVNALNSVLSQNEKDIEIIVTDDSTSDEIADYCSTIVDKRIHYYHNIPSLGAVRNWNYGISLAMSQNIIILHHDEEFGDPNFLSLVLDGLSKSDIVVSNILVRKSSNKINRGLIPDWLKKFFLCIPSSLLILNYIGPCACIAFKKKLSVLFDTRFVWLVDCEWYYRLFKMANSYSYLSNQYIISNHGHKEQISNNLDIYKCAYREMHILLMKYSDSILIKLFVYLKMILYKIRLCRI